MKKSKYKLIIILISLLVLMLTVLLGIGEYFFHYTLVRKNHKPGGANRNVLSTVTKQNEEIISKNKEIAQNNLKNWISSENIQKVSVVSNDNLNLVGTLFKNEKINGDSHNYAIIIHGYSKQKEDVYDIAQNYCEQGFSVVTPDLRAHGESDGKYIGMGMLDKEDIKIWIKYILSLDNDAQIFLHGVSMGAATAMMTSGENLPENVKGIVEDCGYTSVRDIFASELKVRFGLPDFPLMYSMALVTYLHAGYNILESSSINQISKSSIPILVIHGSADGFTPVDMAYRIKDAVQTNDFLIVDGAGHAESRFLNPDKYYDTIWNFLKLH